jgi:hypothetical protein
MIATRDASPAGDDLVDPGVADARRGEYDAPGYQ